MFNEMLAMSSGGGETHKTPIKESITLSSTPKVYKSKNLMAANENGYSAFGVLNGQYEVLENDYPTLIIASYNATTFEFSIYSPSGTYPHIVYYEPLD